MKLLWKMTAKFNTTMPTGMFILKKTHAKNAEAFDKNTQTKHPENKLSNLRWNQQFLKIAGTDKFHSGKTREKL